MAADSSPQKIAGAGTSSSSPESNNRAAISPSMDVPASSSPFGSTSEAVPIAFFDVETSIPHRSGQGYALLEFGALIVCPRRLVELACYSTLIRPPDLSVISEASVRCNGITRDSVSSAPDFQQVADRIYEILHGKVWAGHNILRFDCLRIKEAFESIGRQSPEPVGTIDSLRLLSQRFGKRAGDMKMATLANYFGIGRQKHRSLDDVRMNLEVLKSCATVLFLESSLTESPIPFRNTAVSSRSKAVSPVVMTDITSTSSSYVDLRDHQRSLHHDNIPTASNPVCPPDLTPLIEQMKLDPIPESIQDDGFLDSEMVSSSCISASMIPSSYRNTTRIVMMHNNTPLQLFCKGLKVQFGVNNKFLDYAGRPKLSIVVNAPLTLCNLLDQCDALAQRSVTESGSDSDWRAVVKRAGTFDSSTIRLQIPTIVNGNVASYSTEIYQKEPSGNTQKLVFSRMDVEELQPLFVQGTLIDAYVSIDVYDYQQNAGIRLVAKKLIIHPRQEKK